ncbi:hypothetical protein D1164_18810 [Mariniphaga sediminis]|uniref:Exo-alpha-sialidase n=1 Tax=Mariniphaga sediminis TaxID=1628158 RepID=A0A399CUZ4_9BACT|nr:BNR-4 repeat-containing protein [Mariniphaga sediminis]RIH63634.1 hypothetical protein D1164_18810 [Mariniphaga sediminis]
MRLLVFLTVSVLLSSTLSCTYEDDNVQLGEWTPKAGGCGGIFFYADEGPLVIEIEKQDLNKTKSSTALRAIFVGPDRKLIQDLWIPDDNIPQGGGTGPAQSLILNAEVEHPGVYAVMITVANDRYGENIIWRFRTSCKKYMIETSRGHRDQHHEEPIVLHDAEREADLCFLPPDNTFSILATNLADDVESLELKDAQNRQIAVISVKNDTAFYTVDEGTRLATPWKLHFEKAQSKVQIQGVTKWSVGDESNYFHQFPNGAFWTPSSESWFSVQSNRWLLTPHNRTIFGDQGEKKSISFKVHNNGIKANQITLELEFPNQKWDIQLSEEKVDLAPNEEKEITLNWIAEKVDQVVHLRATCDDYSTYSTLYAKAGRIPTDSHIDIPLVLKPYFQEHEQYGYLPDYPLDNQPYFNIDNRPFVRTEDGVFSLKNEKWDNVQVGSPNGSIIAFGADGDVYTLAKKNDQAVLLHSQDGGKSFTSYDIPGSSPTSRFDIEQFSGHNIPAGPPPVTRYTQRGADKNHFWRRHGDLELLIPKKGSNGIEWKESILISEKCLGVSSHSGIPSSLVSLGSKIFIVWGEVSDPEVSKEIIPGVPVYVTSYDIATGKLEKPILVGYGAPPNDVHNIPGITLDSKGFLHVLTGTHGRPFNYTRSIEPGNINGGWTEAEPVMDVKGSQSSQTYLGLVTGKDNTLHLAFRLWRYNTDYFPNNYFASLAYMSKKPGEPWSEPVLLVVAPFSSYSVYRHRFTIDRLGRLYLSFDYWSTYWFYRNDKKDRKRTLLMSPDGGLSWKLADNKDLKTEIR